MKQLRYIVYARKSTEDEERQVLSISSQLDSIKKQFSDLRIVGCLEESKSAFEPDKRPVFSQILEMLDADEIDGIIAWHPDRLSRNAIDAAAISHRITNGVIKDLKFASYNFDNSPEGIMMLQMTMSQSQYFSSKLSKDIRRGNVKKRKLGGLTGRAHVGYLNDRLTKDVIIDPVRFPIIRKAFDLFLTGEYSVQNILRIVNDDWGFKTVKRHKSGGGSMSRTALYDIFRNVRYAGLIPDPYDTEKFYDADFPAMITTEEFDKVQALLGAKGRPRLCASKQFVLKGFIRCGECGCMITAETKRKTLVSGATNKHTYYHCTRKRPCNQRTNVREADLFEELNDLIDGYELTPKLYDWGMDALAELAEEEVSERNNVQAMQVDSIAQVQKQLDTLLDMATKGFIDADEYKVKGESLKKDLKARQEEQADTAHRTKNWYEFVGDTLQTLTYANTRFVEGDLGDKKEILLAIGQNPTLLDGKLQITPCYWLEPVKNEVKSIRQELNKVRTKPVQIQKASEEAIRLKWCRVQDSNLRRHKPSDLQSDVFDRFTNPAIRK